MPFKVVTTVIHEGRADYDEPLLVHTTAGNRICVMAHTRAGSKSLMIRPRDWPKPVLRAAEELMAELHKRGKAVDLPDFTAWIDSGHTPVVGGKIHVFLVCEAFDARNKTIVLRGTITGFTVP